MRTPLVTCTGGGGQVLANSNTEPRLLYYLSVKSHSPPPPCYAAEGEAPPAPPAGLSFLLLVILLLLSPQPRPKAGSHDASVQRGGIGATQRLRETDYATGPSSASTDSPATPTRKRDGPRDFLSERLPTKTERPVQERPLADGGMGGAHEAQTGIHPGRHQPARKRRAASHQRLHRRVRPKVQYSLTSAFFHTPLSWSGPHKS